MLNNPNFPQDSGMAEMQERLKARLEQAKTDAQKVALVRSAVENARSAIAKDVLSNMKDEISITNLDEVKLHLRNELGRFSKPLLKMLKDYSISADKIEQIEKDMEVKANSAFDDSFQTVIVRKPKEVFHIGNFGEIEFPQDVSINNLEDLEECIEELGNVIRDTFNVEIPTPQVHVEAPNVTVNPAPVNIDATDLQPVVDALEPLKLLSNDPKNPIAVRMSDGEEYVDLLRDIAQNTSQPVMMSGGYPDVTINNTTRNPVPITGSITVDTTGLATSAKQDSLLTELQLKADLTETQPVGGSVAHDSADSGNPIKIGGKAVSSEPAAVTAADRANLITDLVGKLIVLPYANPENFVSGCISSAMTGTTSTSLIAAPASGLRNYITQITVSNTHATVGTNLEIQDGNGGTTYYIIPAAAVYGGATLTFPTPLRQPTTATAVYVKNTTTGASTFASASGYKGA